MLRSEGALDPASIAMDVWLVVRDLTWNPWVVSLGTGLASGGSLGGAAHGWQARKARVLPALPSHVHALERPPDDAVRFFAAVHDLTMAVTEAWNAGRARSAGGTVEELVRKDALRAAHDAVQDGSARLRERLGSEAQRASEAARAEDALASLWTYSSRDNYRTETYTVTTTDSKGKTRTETRTRQVYVNTDHWFEFEPQLAPDAKRRLSRWVDACRGTSWTVLGVREHRVDPARMDPVERSFLERLIRATVLEDPEAQVSPEDLERYANQWLLGTRIDDALERLQAVWSRVDAVLEERFAPILRSQRRYHYVTTSRIHSGPEGYVATQGLRSDLRDAIGAWASVDGMLQTCTRAAADLVSWADDARVVEGDRAYADAAVAAYQAAFPASEIQVDQLPSHGWTATIASIAGVMGSLVSFALHPAGFHLMGP